MSIGEFFDGLGDKVNEFFYKDDKPKIDLQIITANGNVRPIVKDEILWTTDRVGAPSRLEFTVVKDQALADFGGFSEGDQVGLMVDGMGIFKGYIFEKSRDKDHHIRVTAYDQLRYFANRHTKTYTNRTADALLRELCNDFNLEVGFIAPTNFAIAARDEDNQTLFDMVLNALDLTHDNTKADFVLYDNYGKITLMSINDMKVPYMVTPNNAQNFSYTTSIDKDTYTEIKIRIETDKKNKNDKAVRDIGLIKDKRGEAKWGRLVLVVDMPKGTNVTKLGDTLIKLKSRKTRDLNVVGVSGDFRVRAGVQVPVWLDLGDWDMKDVALWMQCESVTHHITYDYHTMDLTIYDSGVREFDEQDQQSEWIIRP